ncbi:MAG: PH domain-containing protein [Lysobacteraceae bacterium]
MSVRDFNVVAPDPRGMLLVAGFAMAAACVPLLVLAREQPALWIGVIVMAMVLGVVFRSTTRNGIALEGATLRVRAGLHRLAVEVATLDLDAARIVDLAGEPALKPMLKTFGTSMPGYQTGHFRLRDRGKAFLLLTERRKVLVLSERSGRRLLLSLERPQALLDAVRAVTERPGRR